MAKVRSRNGCHACKKAKVKCDEARPSCTNCQKFGRKCDYSIVLVWGGRPYKNQKKKEKLNKIASLSRKQLREPASKVVLPFKEFKVVEEKGISSAESGSDLALVAGNPLGPDPNTSASTFLNPSNNLQYLLKMAADGAGSNDSPEETFPSLEEAAVVETIEWPDLSPDDFFLPKSFEFPIETIPRGLSPLPDMLSQDSYFHESFEFFVNHTYRLLTPADTVIYQNNPFKVMLPRLAMQNDGLMSLLVAFGATHRSGLLGQAVPSDVMESLVRRALKDLLALLDNASTSTSDLTLTLILVMSSFMVFTYRSDIWRLHIKGARQILLMRGYGKPFSKLETDFQNDRTVSTSSELQRSRLLYFLIRWFAYIDIFTDLSSPLRPKEPQEQSPESTESMSSSSSSSETILTTSEFQPQIDYDIGGDEKFIKAESHKDIDYILGFNIRFLPLYAKLCRLIKRVNVLKQARPLDQPLMISPEIVETSLLIERRFHELGRIEFDPEDIGNSRSFNNIVASNHCFMLMGLLQLYRRVLLVPRHSKLVQEMSNSLVTLLEEFVDTANSPSALCLILPMFVGGCECEDPANQELYRVKMKHLIDQGSPSASLAAQIMEECWRTGRDWDEIMHTDRMNAVFL